LIPIEEERPKKVFQGDFTRRGLSEENTMFSIEEIVRSACRWWNLQDETSLRREVQREEQTLAASKTTPFAQASVPVLPSILGNI
jgi:hypothetical protein